MSGGVVCCWTHSVSEAESENISECHSQFIHLQVSEHKDILWAVACLNGLVVTQ